MIKVHARGKIYEVEVEKPYPPMIELKLREEGKEPRFGQGGIIIPGNAIEVVEAFLVELPGHAPFYTEIP